MPEPDSEDEGFDLDEEGHAGFLFASSGSVLEVGADPRPIRELYRVFSRPRTQEDEEAGALARRSGALDMGSPDEASGKVLEDEGRLLLAGLGGDEDMLYAAPTENGHICHALLPNGGGGCGPPGPDGLSLSYSYRHGGGLVVYGLVGDDVASVELAIQGERLTAHMAENAFGLRVPDAKPSHFRGLVLYRRDRSRREIGLG